MSGGSYNYLYSTIEDTYGDAVYDEELNLMLKDLCEVLHDLEWWRSDDTSEKDYRASVRKFKRKWFGARDKRLTEIINKRVDRLREELLEVVK